MTYCCKFEDGPTRKSRYRVTLQFRGSVKIAKIGDFWLKLACGVGFTYFLNFTLISICPLANYQPSCGRPSAGHRFLPKFGYLLDFE